MRHLSAVATGQCLPSGARTMAKVKTGGGGRLKAALQWKLLSLQPPDLIICKNGGGRNIERKRKEMLRC